MLLCKLQRISRWLTHNEVNNDIYLCTKFQSHRDNNVPSLRKWNHKATHYPTVLNSMGKEYTIILILLFFMKMDILSKTLISWQSFPSPSFRVPISSLRLRSRFFRDRFRVRGHTGSNFEADSESDSETSTERLGISSPSLPFSI